MVQQMDPIPIQIDLVIFWQRWLLEVVIILENLPVDKKPKKSGKESDKSGDGKRKDGSGDGKRKDGHGDGKRKDGNGDGKRKDGNGNGKRKDGGGTYYTGASIKYKSGKDEVENLPLKKKKKSEKEGDKSGDGKRKDGSGDGKMKDGCGDGK